MKPILTLITKPITHNSPFKPKLFLLSSIFFTLFLILYSVFFVLAPSALAQKSAPKDPDIWVKRQERVEAAFPDQSLNLDQHNFQSADSIATMIGCLADSSGCTDANGTPLAAGAVQTGANIIASITTKPPIRTSEWVADVLNNSGLAGDAYAQGIGFSALTPVLPIWKAFRNISYFLFIIVFVVIGFMIMFRSNIDPQTVVTIQSALPKMIITLLLITFSYAIAGLVVDMIYLTIFIATALFETFGILQSAATARDALFGHSIVRLGISYLMAPGEAAGAGANAITDLIAGAISMGDVGEWITGSLAYLIVAVAVVIAVFRTLFSLIFSYIGIIVSTIFAPIQLLTNAFPGSNTFGSWIKGLVANAAVFPAVAIFLLIGVALIGQPFKPDEDLGIIVNPDTGYGEFTEGRGFIPPLITTGTDQTGVDAVRAVIGLGMIMLLPEIAKVIKEMFGIKDGLGELAGEGLKRGTSPITTPLSLVGGALIQHGSLPAVQWGYRQGGKFMAGVRERRRLKESFTTPGQDTEVDNRIDRLDIITKPQDARSGGGGVTTPGAEPD